MNILLLIFFALPVATIILSVVLETFIHCSIKVAAIFFAIYLVIAFVVGNELFLIAVIAYTILAFISAYITKLICQREHTSCHFPYQATNDLVTTSNYNNSLYGYQERYGDISPNTNTTDYNAENEYYHNYSQNTELDLPYSSINNNQQNYYHGRKKNAYQK